MPRSTPLLDKVRTLLPGNWWPHGVGADRKPPGTCLRHVSKRGLTGQRGTRGEAFAPELVDA